jgi:hypothetical protein
MGGLEDTLWGLRQHFLPLALTIVVIYDFEEEEHVQKEL